MRTLALWIICAAACTEEVQLAPDPLGNLVSIELSPNDDTITISDLSQPPQTLTYHAIGVFSDGSRRDITTMLSWSVDNPAPGSFLDPGTYTTSNAGAGHVGVTAQRDGVMATALLTVVIDAVIIDPIFPPPDASLFDPANAIVDGDPTHAPAYLYPSDGTEFPQGVADTLFQATLGDGNDALELTFDTDTLHLVVMTGADRWDTGGDLQALLAHSNVGSPIQVGIDAASSAAPGTIYSGPSIALQFEQDVPEGVIYFWSAATSGIMRGDLAAASAPTLYPSDGTCVGCHASTRDGFTLAMGYGSETTPLLQSIDAINLATTIDHGQNIDAGWEAYSPDGSMVLVANAGQLVLRDAQTGAPIGTTGKVTLPLGHYGTHPDWSPDGASVAIAYTATLPTNLNVQGASIAVLHYNGDGTFAAPVVIVAATGVENDYFPRYSPDGGYLAYVQATEPSYGAASAELELVPSTGGTPTVLYEASHRVGSVQGMIGIADTMPTWAPSNGMRAYLAFTSTRPYGVVLPTTGRGQIWVSSIDLSNVTPAVDPSAAAFWLPCQDVTVLNNSPVWVMATSPE